ncbi:hypothetical protein H6P81_012601 [Aristolochia fimbriata]|uniref:Cellulose synthase-like protein G2 n=1 Tax=Aristolochia fimbriata TaxID=158543 RepID=A0AAV7ECK4_ARIFI|nr:hypothetical protein H6P81_012601 [Aristolochia fimbriata]
MTMEEEAPLHELRVEQPRMALNRAYTLFHSSLLLALLYHRATSLFFPSDEYPRLAVVLARATLFAAEVMGALLWVLAQGFRWRPVARTVFPDRLPPDNELPPIDVIICTADPEKEPPVDVMNTVISAMSLDYPPEKLRVYLSDDAGSSLTQFALKEAFYFARPWLGYCNKNRVMTRAPEAYFSSCLHGDGDLHGSALMEKEKMKLMYEDFKQRIKRAEVDYKLKDHKYSTKEHTSSIQLIHEEATDLTEEEKAKMPSLVYVAREKRRGIPHHFKAGALNVLLRVSGILSNAPYVLVLDCDMYCNGPNSARQAMCFHLDPKMSHNLAFVQFPQAMHNVSPSDIYDGSMKWTFELLWKGLDGVGGPILSGTCFYLKRKVLHDTKNIYNKGEFLSTACDMLQLRQRIGPSHPLIGAMKQSSTENFITDILSKGSVLIQEAHNVASCSYEKETQWGKEVGFLYHSLVEDNFTGFNLHCGGLQSAFCVPARTQFLGSAPINMTDCLLQSKRWSSGLLQVAFSRYCPLIYGTWKMSIPLRMCYAYMAFLPLSSLFLLCYALVSPLCFFNGISLFPKASTPWFLVFAGTYISCVAHSMCEKFSLGGSFGTWWSAERMWMMRSVSSYLLGLLSVTMKQIGKAEVDFELTNKVNDEEQAERYAMGIFDFQGGGVLLFPLITVALLNLACLIGGIGRMVIEASYDALLAQVFLGALAVVASYPIIEGVFVRKDRGKIPISEILKPLMLSVVIMSSGYLIFSL